MINDNEPDSIKDVLDDAYFELDQVPSGSTSGQFVISFGLPDSATEIPVKRGFLAKKSRIQLNRVDLVVRGARSVRIRGDDGIQFYTFGEIEFTQDGGHLILTTNESATLEVELDPAEAAVELIRTEVRIGEIERTVTLGLIDGDRLKEWDLQ